MATTYIYSTPTDISVLVLNTGDMLIVTPQGSLIVDSLIDTNSVGASLSIAGYTQCTSAYIDNTAKINITSTGSMNFTDFGGFVAQIPWRPDYPFP